jgi:hypothetical protein
MIRYLEESRRRQGIILTDLNPCGGGGLIRFVRVLGNLVKKFVDRLPLAC